MKAKSSGPTALPLDSPERRILILTAQLAMDERSASELDLLVRRNIDWDNLVSHSKVHGTAGLLYRNLTTNISQDLLPEAAIENLRNFYLLTTATGLQYLLHLKEFAEAANAVGVEIMVLKGAAMAEELYGDLGLRQLSDVDLLIREEDWPAARNILEEQGYWSDSDKILPPKLTRYDIQAHMQYLSPSGYCLEFQFDLYTLGIGMRDIDGVWQRARKSEVNGVPVLIASPEDQLLHLAIHANRHGLSRLKWLVDITESLRKSDNLDWDLLVGVAIKEKVNVSVYQTLRQIERIFGIELVRGDVMERLKPRRYQKALWSMAWPRDRLDEFRGRNEDAICFYFYKPLSGWNLLNFAIMSRMRDKLKYQARWIFPPISWMSRTYGTTNSIDLLKFYTLRMVDYKQKRKKEG